MAADQPKPQRRSPRLQGYDYSQNGAYFVTICTQNGVCLFGDVVDGSMELNDSGRVIASWWEKLPEKFPDIEIDLYTVMPNHFHGIVVLGTKDSPVVLKTGEHIGSPLHRHIQWFKTMTTNAYILGVREHGWQSFPGKLWQRSFHDHIIRNEHSLNLIREYVMYNPARLQEDRLNLGNLPDSLDL